VQYKKSAAFDAWVSACAGTVRDFILFDYTSAASQASNVNARIAGGELGARWRPVPQWNLRGCEQIRHARSTGTAREITTLRFSKMALEISFLIPSSTSFDNKGYPCDRPLCLT
jgi:hypothetical protein